MSFVHYIANAWKTLTPTLVVSRVNSSFHFKEIQDSRFFQGSKKRKFGLQLNFGLWKRNLLVSDGEERKFQWSITIEMY